MTDHEGLRAQLTQGAQALGVPLQPESLDQLLAYVQLMARWNKVYNLTAVRDAPSMVTQHLLDSLAVLPALQRWAAGRASTAALPPRLVDVGSGGGLPGVVIAVLNPAWPVVCVDAVSKKASFIRQVAGELKANNLQPHHGRVENWHPPQLFDLITSRAFASLADFVGWTQHLLAPGGVWMALKGKVPDEEIAALPPHVEVFHVEHLEVPGLDAQRCLVWIKRKESL